MSIHNIDIQTANAISEYWQMRANGKTPSEAAAHARQRFGVRLDSSQMEFGIEPTPERRFVRGDRCRDSDGDLLTVTRDQYEKFGESVVDIIWDDTENFGVDGCATAYEIDDLTLVSPIEEQPTEVYTTITTEPNPQPVNLNMGTEFCRTIIGAVSTPSTPVGVNLS